MSKRSLNPIREAQTKWTAAMDDETMDEGDCELSWKCQGCLQCCVKNKDNKSTIAMKREASFQEAQFSNNFEHKEPSKYGSKMAKTIPQQAQSQTEKKREIFEGYPKEHPRIPKPPKSQKFVCPHCPRTFLKEALLQDHLRMHTGPLPYSCSVCPMLLPRAADLRKHMESHLDRRFNQNEGSTQKFDNQAKADVLEYFPRVKTKLSKLPAESLCRVCLRSSKDMVNIFEETLPPGGIALADVISQCTENSVAKGDSFPKSICRPCLVHIQAAFEIRQTFERSRRFFGMMQQQSLKEDVSKGKLQLYVEDDEASNSQSLKDADSVVDFSKISSSDPQKMSAEQSDGLDFFMEQDDCENFSKKVNDFTRRRKPKKYVDSLDSDDSINKPMEDSNDKDFDARKSEARDDDFDATSSNATSPKQNVLMNDRKHMFVCPVCSQSFSNKGNLKTHIQTVHNGERPFMCPHCNTGFSHKGNLKNHIRTHTRETPFKCTVCSSSFTKNYNLKIHMRIHTGELPYRCTLCPVSLKRRDTFNMHMMSHSDHSDSRPHKCSRCAMTFKFSNSLRKHMQRKHST